MFRRLYTDPSFLLLVAINIYCIIYYHNNPSEFATIVWLYWFQSVLIGIFNFFDMLTVSHPDLATDQTGKPVSKGCMSFFFLVHYNGFHFVYAIFILAMIRGHVDFLFLLIGVAAFGFNLIMQFIQHKRMQKTMIADMRTMMFLPYLRIVPMHLMILGPAFLHWGQSDIFLVLKTIADVLMYIIATPYRKIQTEPTSA